ncbi:MAG: hypothetical protein M1832_001951 [Thelocarpon impressellum]|nr:MAG: hypothetical protein M1832_001951 [Thelocarpon impressellum]
MSLQTRVLVDGVWTTRTVDLETIITQNSEPKKPSGKMQEPDIRAPTMGLLSRTVVRSPSVNWILPARIRHEDKNDIVFVGDTSIHIKEVRSDGHLQDVLPNLDIDARITHARVVGDLCKPVAASLDDYIKKEDPDPDPDPDTEMTNGLPRRSTHRQPLKAPAATNPSQMLVLSLDTHEMLFLSLNEKAGGTLEPITRRKPLPRSLSRLDQPVREERYFALQGIILRMEFLHPPPGDEGYVILLLVVSQ